MPATTLDQIVSLSKRRGFIFPGSDIYGGLANTWDYGPLGVELKNRVKKQWWRTFVRNRTDMFGLDAAILMNPKVWEASGHVGSFTDPLIDCKSCKQRFRADKLIEEATNENFPTISIQFQIMAQPEVFHVTEIVFRDIVDPHWSENEKNYAESILSFISKNKIKNKSVLFNSLKELNQIIRIGDIKILPNWISSELMKILEISCPNCGAKNSWSQSRSFNLMFKTQQGVIEGEGSDIYLRPETAQGIFVNFKNVMDTMRPRLPFGVAQIGKAFRNEITPGNFTFRTREFEQMEIEYFFDPEATKWEDIFAQWKEMSWSFITETLGVSKDHLRLRDHEKDELSHYSKGTTDIEYKFPFGWGELCAAAAYRGDYDLSQHEKFSGQELKYTDPDAPTRKFIPHVMEPSFGSDRVTLAVLLDAYNEEVLENGETRVVMKFKPGIAPVDVAILPLSKKEHLTAKAKDIYQLLLDKTDLTVDFDVTGSIGKRYRRQDEIGTPKCITVDFGTLGEDTSQGEKDTVTIRDRDTLKQERVSISTLVHKLAE